MGVPGGISHAHIVSTAVQYIGCAGFIIKGHIVYIVGNLQGLAFLGRQLIGLSEGGQFLILLLGAGVRRRVVYLNHFFSAVGIPCVGHFHFHSHLLLIGGYILHFHIKVSIGLSVSKGVCGIDAKGIKVAVAHVNTLFIDLLVMIPVLVCKSTGCRIVPILFRPGAGQLA